VRREVGGRPLFFSGIQTTIQEIIRQFEALAAPVAEEERMELWAADLRQENGRWILRLMLEREGGATLEDLTRVHRQLSDLLDIHDIVPWHYTLEVSSPGVNRPLLRLDHYRRYLGQRVRIQTKSLQNGRRMFVGVLSQVEDGRVGIVDGDIGLVCLPLVEVRKATVEYEFPSPGIKRKGVQR
jgi:ribosome maturation factor RimP